jgi:hypothetical protein
MLPELRLQKLLPDLRLRLQHCVCQPHLALQD